MNDLDILQDQLNTTDESQDISQLALSDGYGYGYGYGYNGEIPLYVYRGILMLVWDQFGDFGEFTELVGNIESYGKLEDGTTITLTSPVFFYGGCTYIFVATGKGDISGINDSGLPIWGECDDFYENGCRIISTLYNIEIPEEAPYVYFVDGFGLTIDGAGPYTWSCEGLHNHYVQGEVEVSHKFNLKVNKFYPKNSYFKPLLTQTNTSSIESILSGGEYTYFNVEESFGNRFCGFASAKRQYSFDSDINYLVNDVVDNVLRKLNSPWNYTIQTSSLSQDKPILVSYFDSPDKTFTTHFARYQNYPSLITSNPNYYSDGQWDKTNLRKLVPVQPYYDKYEAWDLYPIISVDYSQGKTQYLNTYKYDIYYIKVFITKGGSLLSSSELQNYQITNAGNKYKFVEDSVSDYQLYDNGRTNVSPTITLHSDISGDSSSNYTSSGMYFGLLTPETADTTKTISIGLCDSQNNQVVVERSYSVLKTKDQFNMTYIVLDIPEDNSVFVGDASVYNCFVGDIPVQKIYVGDTQVWTRS